MSGDDGTEQSAVRFHNDYDQYFDPDVYLKTHVSGQEEELLRAFILDKLHDFCQRADVTGSTLLDLGCGPTITGVISAMNKFQHIYLSDISRPNLETLAKWLNNDPGHHDWSPFFKYILDKEGSRADWELRETVLRSYIRGILRCDVTMTNCLSPCHFSPFDAIVSIMCLNAACKNVTYLRQVLKNVAQLLKPGGWAMIVDDLEESQYRVGKETFHYANITLKEYRAAWEDAGFAIVEIASIQDDDEKRSLDRAIALLARKV